MEKLKSAYICDGTRTAFGRYGGSLSSIRADDLAALPLKFLMERYRDIDWKDLDEVILGCANQSGEDNRNVARMALLLAGLSSSVPGITVNRLCASGLEAVAMAARSIRVGEANLILAGGVEHMTRAPYVMGKADSPFGRAQKIEDTTMGWRFVNPKLKQLYGVDTMPETAERVAQLYRVSREDQDAFAFRSQSLVAQAIESGIFKAEIMPVELPPAKGQAQGNIFDKDEQPRDTTMEGLSKLKGVIKADGTVTAGNSSGLNDGSAALLIASEEMIKKYNLKPLARIVGSSAAGVDPNVMGIGPVPAVRKLLAQHDVKLSDIGLIELNEAFAAQAVAVLRDLEIPEDAEFVNPHGGAIALGHPLGASGARLVLHAALEMQRRASRYAICTMCVGVGQGAALLLEKA